MKARIVMLVAAALLAGCAGLSQETRPTVWLALEPAPPAGGLRAGGPTIEVERFAGAPPFDGDRVATREGVARWAFATYHRWVAAPGEMVAARLRDGLGRLNLFGAVFNAPAPVDADYRLSGTVRGLWWDREARSAVVEVEASLVAARSRLLGFWVRRVAVPVSGDSVEDYLASASKGLAQIIADLGKDIGGAMAGPSGFGPGTGGAAPVVGGVAPAPQRLVPKVQPPASPFRSGGRRVVVPLRISSARH